VRVVAHRAARPRLVPSDVENTFLQRNDTFPASHLCLNIKWRMLSWLVDTRYLERYLKVLALRDFKQIKQDVSINQFV
jgi:hypothetical protein